jgi:hypothetical protein
VMVTMRTLLHPFHLPRLFSCVWLLPFYFNSSSQNYSRLIRFLCCVNRSISSPQHEVISRHWLKLNRLHLNFPFCVLSSYPVFKISWICNCHPLPTLSLVFLFQNMVLLSDLVFK